ncbi:MAG: ABC transporter permease [Alphaproteobacteria bacterium]|nr:ABC transporter permease [Alphaproteobacteria bacterium]
MRRVWLVVRRELLEHRRQPGMLVAMGLVQAAIVALVTALVGMLALIARDPKVLADFEANLAAAGIAMVDPVPTVVENALAAFDFLLVSQLLGMTAVLAAQALVHERQCGTLPFLLLAPLRRTELVLGKAIASALTPWLIVVGLGLPAALWMSTWSVVAPFHWRLPPHPGWLVSFLLGGPLWAMALASVAAALSARVRDVRTAQQGAWMVVFVASIVIAGAIGGALVEDTAFQLFMAAVGLVATLLGVGACALVLGRDPLH